MGYLDFKELCIHCEKKVGLSRYKAAQGFLCADCFKKCGYHKMTPILTKTITDIELDIKEHSKKMDALSKLSGSKTASFIDKTKYVLSMELEIFKTLLDGGLISQEEYETKQNTVYNL
ncbi:MAG: SHOCT domain-containing protein [Acetobacterium sp.]